MISRMTRPSGHAAIVSPGPLSGIRALELAEIWAGPFCGSLLADMGAEVNKVEAIQRIARGSIRPGPGASGYPDGEPGERPWNRNANFNVLSRNKLGITLDLTTPDGADTFKELVNVSDVVFTNYAFGVMDKFGLGYEELRKVKPDVIALFTPGYGNTGPYRTFRSMGMVIDAITGHTALRGYPDMDVSRNSLVHHPDAVAGATAVFSICLAIHNRARTGKGRFIDLSQAEAFMPHLGEVFLEHSIVGTPRSRRGNRHPGMAPHGAYQCAGDDQWVTVSVRTDEEWREMCQAMQMPQLAHNPKFETLPARLRNQDELDLIINRWTRQLDRYQVANLLQEHGIAAGPIPGLWGRRIRRSAPTGSRILPGGGPSRRRRPLTQRSHMASAESIRGAARACPRSGSAQPGGTGRPRGTEPQQVGRARSYPDHRHGPPGRRRHGRSTPRQRTRPVIIRLVASIMLHC